MTSENLSALRVKDFMTGRAISQVHNQSIHLFLLHRKQHQGEGQLNDWFLSFAQQRLCAVTDVT
jgi:hypothetical protein